MLRFLLRRSRKVRVPRENGPFTLQKVSITQASKYVYTVSPPVAQDRVLSLIQFTDSPPPAL